MKKVSIVIPVYNVAKYLRKCMDSVLAQTYSSLEIILVDDGSPDESGEICDSYAQQDSRVVVIHQQNAGAANAKNAGLDRATGDYITFIDSDDYVEPDWIERLVDTAEKHGADVVECDFDKVYQNRVEIANQYPESRVFTAEEYLEQYLGNWTCSLFWNKLFCAKLLPDIRFRRERRCIDDEFFTYKVVSRATRIVRIQDVLYHYRQRMSSAISNTKNQMQIADDAVEVLVERYQWICARFPRLRKIYLSHDVDMMLCFAGKFVYTKQTAKKFRKTARFYLQKCLSGGCDRVTLIYVFRLQAIKLRRKATDGEVCQPDEADGFFV